MGAYFDGRDPSAMEIAAEVVDLEARIPEIKARAEETETALTRLRQRKLGGKPIKDEELAAAEASATDAAKDRDTVQGTMEELMKALTRKAVDERTEDAEKRQKLATAKREERKRGREELIKEFAAFYIKWVEVEGFHKYYFEMDGTNTGDPVSGGLFKAEVKRLAGGDLPFSHGMEGEAERIHRGEHRRTKANPEQLTQMVLKEAREEAAKE